MTCLCNTSKPLVLKVEADIGADPIWCGTCGANLELDDFPVSSDLKRELTVWMDQYGEWMDWEKDEIVLNGAMLEKAHNEVGKHLAITFKQELGVTYHVRFSPSTMVQHYRESKR